MRADLKKVFFTTLQHNASVTATVAALKKKNEMRKQIFNVLPGSLSDFKISF